VQDALPDVLKIIEEHDHRRCMLMKWKAAEKLWEILQSIGWTKDTERRGQAIYIPPIAKRGNGDELPYFMSFPAVVKFVSNCPLYRFDPNKHSSRGASSRKASATRDNPAGNSHQKSTNTATVTPKAPLTLAGRKRLPHLTVSWGCIRKDYDRIPISFEGHLKDDDKLGMTIVNATFPYREIKGVTMVDSVVAGGAAEKSGVQVGDYICHNVERVHFRNYSGGSIWTKKRPLNLIVLRRKNIHTAAQVDDNTEDVD
jgi:hypothetical protein